MASQKTTHCPTCQGSKFTSHGICRSCEYKCTLESHEALKASLATFKSATTRHRLDYQPEYEIDLLWGDCKCGSTLAYDLSTLTEPAVAPSCYEPRDISDADAKRALEEYQRACVAAAERMGVAA